jgi:TonB family protein
VLIRVVRALVLVLLFAATAQAQRGGSLNYPQRWNMKLEESSRLLESGDHAGSLKIADRVIREMIDELGPGDAATRAFGFVLTHKALALAGLGRESDALWYWHTVLSLYPSIRKNDLSTFGAGGELLASNREVPTHDGLLRFSDDGSLLDALGGPLPADPTITPPKIRRQVIPDYPDGALAFGVRGAFIIEMKLDQKGVLSAPRIVKALPAPTLTYVVVDALRKWKIDPARRNGQPIDAILTLTVQYRQR